MKARKGMDSQQYDDTRRSKEPFSFQTDKAPTVALEALSFVTSVYTT
jgi:hypothetical protein